MIRTFISTANETTKLYKISKETTKIFYNQKAGNWQEFH